VHINGEANPATLVDSNGNELTGTLVLPIVFSTPLQVAGGNHVVELDLDLDQSVELADVDMDMDLDVVFEPILVPRVNRQDPKEHAVGGNLRTVVLGQSLFRLGLEAPIGVDEPVVEVAVGPGTVFQIDGVCLLGAAGLAQLDTLAPGSWVQAFGSVEASSTQFQAATVEAGTGSFNGGSDIVEGLIIDRTGGAGADAVLTVLGHSSDATHTSLQFNLTYTVNTSFANTKVVRRGSATQYSTDALNVGQRVRMFGSLSLNPNVLDVTTTTDVVRMEPTWIFGHALGAPTGGELHISLVRVDLRDQALFDWAWGDTDPADPADFVIDEHNLGAGQGITGGVVMSPIVARGFFAPVDDAGRDLDASILANRTLLPSLLLIRERIGGYTVTTDAQTAALAFGFDMAGTGLERAVIDMGFAGQTDLVPTGVTLVPNNGLGLGVFLLHDRTLNSVELHFTFEAFSTAVKAKLDGGAMLFNVGALGVYDANDQELPTSLAGVTVQ
jgi:hypothetical protein